MAEKDWVCGNCYAQNALGDEKCRVCGSLAPARGLTGMDDPEPDDDIRDDYADVSDALETETDSGRAEVLIHGRNGYRLLGALWAVLILHFTLMILLGVPFWLANNGASTRFAISRADRIPNALGDLLGGLGRSFQNIGFDWFGACMSTISGRLASLRSHGVPVTMQLFNNLYGMSIVMCVVWTIRLFVRCLRGVGRSEKCYGGSFVRLAGEAVAMNLLFFMLGTMCRELPWMNNSLLAIAFSMQTIGIAAVLLPLMMIDTLRGETWKAGSKAGRLKPRLFRRELVQGWIVFVVFFIITCGVAAYAWG